MVQWANNVFGTKKCPYIKCDYETNNKALFVDHLNAIHIKYSNFSCEICDKLFYSKRALLKHKASMNFFFLFFQNFKFSLFFEI